MLETSRLRLDLMTEADASFLFNLVNSRGFKENIGDRKVTSIDDAKKYVKKVQETCAKFGFDPFVVKTKDDQNPIGICNLLKRDYLEHPDIGFAFVESSWGKGLASEAAERVLAHERMKTGLKRIYGITLPVNLGSIRVLEKLGLKFERMVEQPGEVPLKLYARTF